MESIVAGDTILAIAMTEPGTGSDLAGITTRATEMDDHWILAGSKTFISNGFLAGLVIVAARTNPDAAHE
ncbi:acyl-CoA dehydrogenase family protein, partial [Rhizobiaceae sp. 2RAB30]